MEPKYNSLSAAARMEADAAAEWFITLVQQQAEIDGLVLTPEQIWILKHPLWDFTEEIRPQVIQTNNQVVDLVRSAILRLVREGKPTIHVRAGLWVPEELELKYELLFTSEQPWFISGVLQNVFLGNSIDGENDAWTPNNAPLIPAEKPNASNLNKPNNSKTIAWVVGLATAVAIIIPMGVLTVSAVQKTEPETYDYAYDTDEDTSSSSAPEEQTDEGAAIPGDYFDDGAFAWQWVSDPTCEEYELCSQARVFSKFGCEYEVWIDWQTEYPNDYREPKLHTEVIPPLGRGEIGVATLSESYLTGELNSQYAINEIRCGQTG